MTCKAILKSNLMLCSHANLKTRNFHANCFEYFISFLFVSSREGSLISSIFELSHAISQRPHRPEAWTWLWLRKYYVLKILSTLFYPNTNMFRLGSSNVFLRIQSILKTFIILLALFGPLVCGYRFSVVCFIIRCNDK